MVPLMCWRRSVVLRWVWAPRGHQRACEKQPIGEALGAEEARQMGLVARVMARSEVLSHTLERAQMLAEEPASSLRVTKSFVRRVWSGAIPPAMQAEGAHFQRMLSEPAAP